MRNIIAFISLLFMAVAFTAFADLPPPCEEQQLTFEQNITPSWWAPEESPNVQATNDRQSVILVQMPAETLESTIFRLCKSAIEFNSLSQEQSCDKQMYSNERLVLADGDKWCSGMRVNIHFT